MRSTSLIWFAAAGAIVGYLLVHPFAMLAYMLNPQPPTWAMDLSLWERQMRVAFSAEMLVMGGAFALLGGVAGLGLGAWHLQRVEARCRLAALQTLQELMVTLAHYIRNANQIIGGYSAHIQKHLDQPELREQLQLIHRAAHQIEEVINSLESLTEMDHSSYIGPWETKMIDLKQTLQARLEAHLQAPDKHDV